MLSHLLLALSLCFAPPDAVVDRPTLFPSVVALADIAPPPRAVCQHRGQPDCLCADGDMRCRARAALTLAAAARAIPVAVPTTPTKEVVAARKALAEAEAKIKASKRE